MNRHWRQLHPVGDIPDGENVRHRRAAVRIDGDGAVRRLRHADRRQVQRVDVGGAADAVHDRVDLQDAAVGERDEARPAVGVQRCGSGTWA